MALVPKQEGLLRLRYEGFRSDFDRIVAAHGWNYRGSRNWRSRVIFQTNLRMSYAAGRWAQIQRVKKLRPYLRYVHVDPELTQKNSRPAHAKLHNLVLHVDDPFWDHYYPPNDWGCRCSVQSLSERDLKRYGLKVSKSPRIEWEERTINTAEGSVTIKVPEGIAPGFDYNVGVAGFGAGPGRLALARHGAWRNLEAPGESIRALPILPLDRPAADLFRNIGQNEAELRAALRAVLSGDEAIFVDPIGGRVQITQAIVDHMLADARRLDRREQYFPLIPDLIRAPAEIWVGFVAQYGRVMLRRRYIKLIDIGEGKIIGLVTDVDGGHWAGLTYFRGRRRGEGASIRTGLLVYRREE